MIRVTFPVSVCKTEKLIRTHEFFILDFNVVEKISDAKLI